jgi:hypothetical protein
MLSYSNIPLLRRGCFTHFKPFKEDSTPLASVHCKLYIEKGPDTLKESRCLKLKIVPNLIYTIVFHPHRYIPSVKFNLQIMHKKRFSTITENNYNNIL